MTNCLILGGSGFIGSHLAEALIKKHYSVRVFGDFKSGMRNIEAIADRIEIIKGDFQNASDVDSAVQNVDYIFHYISTTNPASSFDNPVYDIETNVISSVRMMEIALKNDVKKIIFPSTGGTIYGDARKIPISEDEPANPLNPYAISKLTTEKYLHYFFTQYGMHYLILRYSNPYGDRQNPLGNQGVIPIFLNKIRHNEAPVIYGDGNSVRDYIYIDDAVDATISLLERGSHEKLFNIGSGTGTTLNQLLKIMSDVTGKSVSPIYKQDEGRYIRKVVLDISKIHQQTGWRPKINISEGIAKTWEWLEQTHY
jgi:UDP-glucose 4-epimerase